MYDPERYESNKSMSAREIDVFLPKIIKSLTWSKHENILDYGCGAGSSGYNHILPMAHLTESTVYAVDCSENMLAYARKHYADNSIVYRKGNILGEFPFKNIKFDKVLAIHMIHFIADIDTALKGFHKLLKPGGQFAFNCVTLSNWMFDSYPILAASETWGKYMKGYEAFMPEWCQVERDYGTVHLRQLLERAGFHVTELKAQERKYYFEDIDVYLELCLSLNPCLGSFPKSLIPSLKVDLKRMMTRFAGIPEDSTSFTYPVEYLYAIMDKKEMTGQRGI